MSGSEILNWDEAGAEDKKIAKHNLGVLETQLSGIQRLEAIQEAMERLIDDSLVETSLFEGPFKALDQVIRHNKNCAVDMFLAVFDKRVIQEQLKLNAAYTAQKEQEKQNAVVNVHTVQQQEPVESPAEARPDGPDHPPSQQS